MESMKLSEPELPGVPKLKCGREKASETVRDGRGGGQGPDFTRVELGDCVRVTLMLTPRGRGPLAEQATELLERMREVLLLEGFPMTVTVQTVFLQEERDQDECERLFAAHYGSEAPLTNFVVQAPCDGAALAIEAWAIGGAGAEVKRFGPKTLAVQYDGVRWIYCAGVAVEKGALSAYEQTREGLIRMSAALRVASADFSQVARTWFYLGGITEMELQTQRYRELNSARTDFYRSVQFGRGGLWPKVPDGFYPASTGIGMAGRGLALGCLALQTQRPDLKLLALENPAQTPAYAYHSSYSPQSPKFSRAVALVLGDRVITWISGTASIVNAESQHLDDVVGQTHQTLDNIERLIAPENFAAHGIPGAGARLGDLAKVRVYVKRPADLAACRAVCEQRLGRVPAIYAQADVCRPELRVEIEGVAFSRISAVKS